MYKEKLEMPGVTTLAQAFRDGGYQAMAVGKMHVYPQRNRIGFDDVILDEEGRTMYGVTDDYETFLGDHGYPGRQFMHGMSNNDYVNRPWHLPEELHPTNWATMQMTRTIKRRDPTRPGFWYCSYRHPHPPLTALPAYLEMYSREEIDTPLIGSWVGRDDAPHAIAAANYRGDKYNDRAIIDIRRAFYALCTHIDHQIRILIGTLREEGLLDNTIICFSSDHGDMLGRHNMWAKRLLYGPSVTSPLIFVGTRTAENRIAEDAVDQRLAGWRDIMPTLLDLCGLGTPDHCEGISLFSDHSRDYLYSEVADDVHASRMVMDSNHKLIYYPVGNVFQLFDLQKDPAEMNDLAGKPEMKGVQQRLEACLASELYGGDEDWVRDGKFIGLEHKPFIPAGNRTLGAQRGDHWPAAPVVDIPQIEWVAEKA